MPVGLRIIVLRPVPGVMLKMQDKKRVMLDPAGGGLRSTWFDLEVRVKRSGASADFAGAHVHGRPGGRFLYINVGRQAGQAGSPWSRRAKIPLGTIPVALLDRAARDGNLLLAAAIEGTGRDGGPSCATVPLASAWRLVRRTRGRTAKSRPPE